MMYTLLFLTVLPVSAGVYEDVFAMGEPIFLYLNTQTCRYCRQATPVYNKLSQNYRNTYKFLNVDVDTEYGRGLMFQFKARFVPYTVLINPKKQVYKRVSPECMAEYACVEKELKQFIR